MKTKLEAALGYARRGWKVLPLRPNDKAPYGELVPHGAKDATLDAAIIRGWWERSPEAKCVPPWSEKELLHKMESARANPQKSFGCLLCITNK